MEKKVIKKLLAVIMIITILATDFYVLGSNLKTYATQVTNEIEGYPNIHFSTYFKEGENETKQINKSIKEKQIKLYAKIGVNSDVDYLEDIQIKLKDNFKIISTNKGRIENNTVKLEYIAASSFVEIELNIEPVMSNKISAEMLLKTQLELNARYKYADEPEGKSINALSEASVKYQPDETMKAELTTDIITNKVFSINGEDKRIIQALIKSRLTQNDFPVKQSIINVNIPKLSGKTPEVNTLVIGKLATNGTNKINNITTENGNLQITLNNEIDENNQVSWNRNLYDEIIVTYIYPADVDANRVEITSNSEIKLHGSGNTYTAKYTKGIENKEPNNIIIGRTEITTEELYKGQLYAKIDTQYNTKTSILITNPNIVEKVIINEGNDVLGKKEQELVSQTKYISTTINLEKMLEILGQDGNVTIKNGEKTIKIDKNSTTDKSGNVVINYENSEAELQITTSKPVKNGVLEIGHTKSISGKEYSREQLKEVTKLKTKGTVNGEVISSSTVTEKSSIDLQETTSKAELITDRTTFSATEENELTIGIKLVTDGAKYDLYKNPSISIQFPQIVEKVELVDEPKKLYADEFKITSKNYDPQSHKMTINMTGEQTTFPESSVTQSYIQLKFKIKFPQFTMSQTDEIIMEYRNENATKYDNNMTYGVVKQPVEISAPNELIKIFNISSNSNTSLTEKIINQLKPEDAGKDFNFDIALVNNKDTEMSNIKILGKLPTTGNSVIGESVNTLETILKNINAQSGKVYYTENTSATADVQNIQNGWTQDLTKLTNAKMFLITLDKLARGARFTAKQTIQISNPMSENGLSYTQYEVIYDTEANTEVKEQSRKIGIASSASASIKTEITAKVGQDNLSSGMKVKEGEVIKYRVTVRNRGIETLKNVGLKLEIPEGTVLVRPIKKYIANQGTENEEVIENGGYVYAENGYYEEITSSEELSKLTNRTIPELTTSKDYVIEYEVRVNKGTAGKQISNKSTVTYKDSKIESQNISNTIEEANIRVTVKRAVDESIQLLPNGTARYIVYVENLSNSKIKNLELQLKTKGFTIKKINDNEDISAETKISEIKPKENKKASEQDYENGMKSFIIYGDIDKDAEEIEICAIVKDSEGKQYRSNLVGEKLPKISGTIDMTSPQNGKYIKEGDTVEYNITVKNTGGIQSVIKLKDEIPEHLKVEAIYQNKELKLQNTSNSINYAIILAPGQTAQIDIITKVQYIPEAYHGKTVTNMAVISVERVSEMNSQVITHILKASSVEEENIENVISGIAWFDENENGRRDAEEKTLSGITAKIFNNSSKQYLTDKNGNVIEAITGDDGEYAFVGIPDGSYIVIFEYDTEKYEFTTSFAEGVDTRLNSKVVLKTINTGEQQIKVAGIDVNLNENTFNMNIGLKKNSGNRPDDERPGVIPDDDDKETTKKVISGLAWLDSNRNGQKENDEKLLPNIKVKLYDVTNQKYITETTTSENGKYEFRDVEKGSYVLMFEYNTEEYKPTAYMAQGVDTTKNSKVVINKININGEEITATVTDTLEVIGNIYNVNIGLKENLIFDLELNKYISKVVVQTNKKAKTYEYDNKTIAKAEIHRKEIQGALVILEYTIKVKNNGEIAGYVSNIVDYLPSGLTFNSELNKDWYLSGSNLYTKNLEKVELKPGEEKEVKLILTKTMTNENAGLINNRAEIYQDYNKFGEVDIDSTPNNQVQSEDDFGSVDVIIQVETGASNSMANLMLLLINAVLIGFALRLMIRNRMIRLPSRKWRR